MRAGTTIAVTLLALGLAPAGATATPADVAATHAYVQANYALAQAGVARIAAGQARVKSFTRKIGRQCRGAGAGGPQNEASQPLSYEAAGALWSVTYGTSAGPIRAFVHALKGLRWSNRALTRIAQRYATSLHELATLPLPDLCGDVRAWSAGGFRTIPAATMSFDRHVEGIEGRTIPPRLLAPYEQPEDRALVRRTTQLESRLEGIEFTSGQDDWNLLLDTLGLHQ